MTKLEQIELETELEEINAAIDDYSAILVSITDKKRAATLLLDSLEQSARNAGAIRYKLKHEGVTA